MFCIPIIILFSCKQENNRKEIKSSNFNEIKTDSIHTQQEAHDYIENIKEEIYKTRDSSFEINNINCFWEYEISSMTNNENSKQLISQKLINQKTNESILDLDLSLFLNPLNNSKPKNIDINFDNYTDFQFSDDFIGGPNQEYSVYLFNSRLKKFQYSEGLSGVSLGEGIELDKEKRIAYYSGKSGGGLYSSRRVHFNLDGSLKYEERFWNEDLDYYSFKDSINHYKYAFYYLKQKNNVTIDSLRVEKEVNDMEDVPIYGSFFEWIETFDK
ncbi:MAG: hypothetical protein WA839_07730 [Flavobacteriaceae bacterium]